MVFESKNIFKLESNKKNIKLFNYNHQKNRLN